MLEVEDRRRRGRAGDERQHHAQWEVDRVELVEPELPAEPASQEERAGPSRALRPGIEELAGYPRTTRESSPSAASSAIVGTKTAVVELPDAGEPPAELAGVGFRAPDDPGNQREERDSDHRGIFALTAP